MRRTYSVALILLLAVLISATEAYQTSRKAHGKVTAPLILNLQNNVKTIFVPSTSSGNNRYGNRSIEANAGFGLMLSSSKPIGSNTGLANIPLQNSWIYLCRKRLMWFSECIESAVDPVRDSVYFPPQPHLVDGDYFLRIKSLPSLASSKSLKYQTMGKSPLFKLLRAGQLSTSHAPIEITSISLADGSTEYGIMNLVFQLKRHYFRHRDIDIVLFSSRTNQRIVSVKYLASGSRFTVPLHHKVQSDDADYYIEVYGYSGWFSHLMGRKSLFYRETLSMQRCESLPDYLKSGTRLLCISFGYKLQTVVQHQPGMIEQHAKVQSTIDKLPGIEVFNVAEGHERLAKTWQFAFDIEAKFIGDRKIDVSLQYLYGNRYLDENLVQTALLFALRRLNSTQVQSQVHIVDPALFLADLVPEDGYPYWKQYHVLSIAVPERAHIILLVYDSFRDKFLIVDSLPMPSQNNYHMQISRFHNYLKQFFVRSQLNWHRSIMLMQCPFRQQEDAYNCGVFSIINGMKLVTNDLKWMERAFQGECTLSRFTSQEADSLRRDIYVSLGATCLANDPKLLFPSCLFIE